MVSPTPSDANVQLKGVTFSKCFSMSFSCCQVMNEYIIILNPKVFNFSKCLIVPFLAARILTYIAFAISKVFLSPPDVSLTYEVMERPEAIRPIPGETVVFSCEVEGTVLIWNSVSFIPPNDITFVAALDPVGRPKADPITGKMASYIAPSSEELCNVYECGNIAMGKGRHRYKYECV